MTTYSRQAFRAWLVTLPDEPREWRFIQYGNKFGTCPIGGWLGIDCLTASRLDPALAQAIDETSNCTDWVYITPRQIIALIDQLEPKQQTTEWCNTPFQPSVREVA